MTAEKFLAEHLYVDFTHPEIDALCRRLFSGTEDNRAKAEIAYRFVRDENPPLL